jgi:UDP-N-acetylglucosamine diphosphorylase/glucosamine-1-phosphate N-acetyltransferase
MKKIIYVFEDSGYENLLPLVYTMPVWDILCGIKTLFEKTALLYPGAEIRLLCRDYLAETVRETAGLPVNEIDMSAGTALFVNGRAVLNKAVPFAGREETAVSSGALVYARMDAMKLSPDAGTALLKNSLPALFAGLKKKETKIPLINYFWDAVELTPSQIAEDFRTVKRRGPAKYPGAYIIKHASAHIGKGAVIKPGVVIDAGAGPVYIGDGAVIEPNAVIEGPCSIARGCIVRSGAVVKSSSIGAGCRVGGEVSQSVMQGYSNKQHGGYLGSSYVGRWCNIGAGANNSDLKNNYSSVKVIMNDRAVDTGRLHVGVLIADHSRCAIGTNFNCGSVVGLFSNVVGKPPKYVKPFSWGESEVYDLEAAIATARVVMKRRGVELTPAGERLLRQVYAMTRK